jgi:UDP-N-acetylmuramyl tripeptide synthase
MAEGEVHAKLAQIYMQKGDLEKAKQEAEQAEQIAELTDDDDLKETVRTIMDDIWKKRQSDSDTY